MKHVREEPETDPRSNMTEITDNDEDPFRHLPEEIVISIFNKVEDLKSLFHCSLVSKHFASVIPLVQAVSLCVSDSGPCTDKSFESMNELALELYDCSSEKIPSLLDSFSLQHLKLPVFLQKLRELKSVCLDYQYPENGANAPFPTRKIKFSSNSIKVERFVGISSRYVHNNTDNDFGSEHYFDNREAARERAAACAWQFFGRYMEWTCRILILAKFHTSLKRVTITDSDFNGKLVIGNEQFSNYRALFEEMVNTVESCNITFASVQVLYLPLSGYVLRGATLVIINVPEDPLLSSKNLDEIMNQEFGDKLLVLQEAVKKVIKNHADRIMLRRMRDTHEPLIFVS